MSEFQFQKSQRVIVPADVAGAEGVQGLVIANIASMYGEPLYMVAWPKSEQVAPDGTLLTIKSELSQSALLAAQPPKMVTVSDAEKLVADAYRRGGDELREEMEQERAARAAKRSKSRKKRR